ncbi:MAG: type II secretion system GspH family protein [Verrucomicrobia bacterium]|nr:type II secretion system GspH family protein [Verrucomicrobiota bacterium]
MIAKSHSGRGNKSAAFTLIEVVLAIVIGGILISGMIASYMQAATRAEWSAYSLAAQSLAVMRLEQTRAAKWDRLAYPPIDQLATGPHPTTVEVLDIPVVGNNIAYATNFTTVTTISANPPIKMVQVDCIWEFGSRGIFTNTIITYRAADQ